MENVRKMELSGFYAMIMIIKSTSYFAKAYEIITQIQIWGMCYISFVRFAGWVLDTRWNFFPGTGFGANVILKGN